VSNTILFSHVSKIYGLYIYSTLNERRRVRSLFLSFILLSFSRNWGLDGATNFTIRVVAVSIVDRDERTFRCAHEKRNIFLILFLSRMMKKSNDN
jgi:hypothetical protein